MLNDLEDPSDRYALGLKPGELVRVRSASEICKTLDEHGSLDGLPFMPEMLKYCGRKWRVSDRADKTCHPGLGKRRMHNTVHLANLRCDGAAHGGCQAACLTFWKEAWLERMEPPSALKVSELNTEEQAFITETLLPATRTSADVTGAEPRYRCQATEIPSASTPLRFRRVDQYVRDTRTSGPARVLRGLAIEVFNRLQSLSRRYLPHRLLFAGGRSYPFIDGKLRKGQAPSAALGLAPGDVVRIKTKAEIEKTLDHTNHNRGLSFDTEMVKYCGQSAQVRGRVERLIDEQSGKMIHIKSDLIILEGVVCTADYHLFCTRSTYPYWREIWLERGG